MADTTAPTPRTTASLVEGIIQVQDGVDLTPFIFAANSMVTALCSDSSYSDGFVNSTMELIERWLSAHFYAIYDQQLKMAKAGSVAVQYQSRVEYGLKATTWGQQAMRIDTAGNLASYDNTAATKRKVNIEIGHMGRNRYGCYPWGAAWSDITICQ